MCVPFSRESADHFRFGGDEPDQEWAERLEAKYGIRQPMAPDDVPADTPSACSMATQAGMRRG